MDYLKFLKRQNQETEKLELAKNLKVVADEERVQYPDIRIDRSESEKIADANFSKDERVTPKPDSPPAEVMKPVYPTPYSKQ